MFETIKWIIIRQLVKWNVLAVAPVRVRPAQGVRRSAYRR